MINLPLRSVQPSRMAARYPQRSQGSGGMRMPVGMPPQQPYQQQQQANPYGNMANNGLQQLAGMEWGAPAALSTTQAAAPSGGLAQSLGVASVPGGVGNASAAGGTSTATGAGGAAGGSGWFGGLFGGGGSGTGLSTLSGGGAGGGMFSGGTFGGGAGGAAGAGAIGYGLGTGADALARKFGASGTSLEGAGAGAGIGAQYGGPVGGLFGAAIGAGAQQATKTVQDPGDTQLFRDPATGNGLPIVGYMPFPGMTELLPDWMNPSIKGLFG